MTEIDLTQLAWDRDGRTLHLDETMQMSQAYDWDGYECFRQEGRGDFGAYIIWPDHIGGKSWNVYGTRNGLYIQDVDGEAAAKAAAQADHDAAAKGCVMTAPASITHDFAAPADNYSIPKWSPIRCVADHLSDAAYLIMLGDAQHRSHYAAEADRHFRELAKLMGYAVTSLEGGIFGAEAAA